MSAFNIANLAAPTTLYNVTTTSGITPIQLPITSDFLELKNAGPNTVFLRTGFDNTVVATSTWTNPTQANMSGTPTPMLPGEIAIYRHTSRPATAKDGGVWVSAVTGIGIATLYITPVEGK